MTPLYQSSFFALYQCDKKRCFLFVAPHKKVWLSCCQLLALRNQIQSIDLETHFDEACNPHGLEILTFCNRDHLLLLDTYQVIDLKRLMKVTFEKLFFSPDSLKRAEPL